MAKTGFASVDDYIAAQPPASRRVLRQLRRTIREAVPDAVESISYGIPAYKLHGRPVVYFAAWQRHYSLYPSSPRLVAAFRKQLAPYELAKGTIRFPISEPVPVQLIEGIARLRAKEASSGKKAAAARKKK
ncbi:MAG TPA: DUF1801 domain-containing protein [Vicinamibacterales bacterium]|nr:DUF1801 domain-containing protein [Vicinamibacterales bacterium]